MSFAKNLQYLRKKNKITQEELADELNVSRQSISKWETGEAYPETDKLISLCDKFDVTLDEIVRGDLTDDESVKDDATDAITEISSDVNEKADNRRTMTFEEKDAFNRFIARYSFWISFGVLIIILGVSALILCGGAVSEQLNYGEIIAIFGVGILLTCIAAAVGIFIYFGCQHSEYMRSIADVKLVFDDDDRKKRIKSFSVITAICVSVIILDVVAFVTSTSLYYIYHDNAHASDLFAIIMTAIFIAVIGFAVFGIVNTSIKNSYVFESEKSAEEKTISNKISSIIMPIAVIVYLCIGFIFHMWHPGWIIFPIAGITCGIIEAIFA